MVKKSSNREINENDEKVVDTQGEWNIIERKDKRRCERIIK